MLEHSAKSDKGADQPETPEPLNDPSHEERTDNPTEARDRDDERGVPGHEKPRIPLPLTLSAALVDDADSGGDDQTPTVDSAPIELEVG